MNGVSSSQMYKLTYHVIGMLKFYSYRDEDDLVGFQQTIEVNEFVETVVEDANPAIDAHIQSRDAIAPKAVHRVIHRLEAKGMACDYPMWVQPPNVRRITCTELIVKPQQSFMEV